MFEDTSAIKLGLEMEPRKRARYSKSMESLEIVEILMEDESRRRIGGTVRTD